MAAGLPSAAVEVVPLLDAGTVASCDAFGVGVCPPAGSAAVPLVAAGAGAAPGAGLGVLPLAAGECGGAMLGPPRPGAGEVVALGGPGMRMLEYGLGL